MDTCKRRKLFFISTYGFLMMFLPLQVSSSTDTLFANQSLSGFETLVSSSGVFELGFFSPGTSDMSYLGIWYKQILPKTIVWVANREVPATNITSVYLSISYGNLILYFNTTEDMVLWSTGLDTDVQAILLDSGNFILRDGSNSSAVVLWQSFDNPSDTWLPGAKIRLENIREGILRESAKFLTCWNTLRDPSPGRYSLKVDPVTRNSLSMVWKWNQSKSYWSSGAWDDRRRTFKQVTDLRLGRNLSFEFNVNESYVTYSVRYKNPFRLVMDASGQLNAYHWLEKQQMWDSPWSTPDQKCKVYGYCGPFGICYDSSFCKCSPPFKPLFRQDSYFHSNNDSIDGCISDLSPPCGKKSDKFVPLLNMKVATDPEKRTPLTTCEAACLASCYCKAYAYDGSQCLIWKSDVFNLQELDAYENEGMKFYVRLTFSDDISSEGGTNHRKARANHRKARTVMLAVLLPLLAAVAAFCISWYCYFSSPLRSKRVQEDKKTEQKDT